MSEIQTSRLQLRKDKKGGQRLFITYLSKKGKELEWSAPPQSLSVELVALEPDALDGHEVDFELIDGHPDRIRPKGVEDWQAPAVSVPARPAGRTAGRPGGASGRGSYRDRRGGTGRAGGGAPAPRHRDFHNPYNFIPTPPRGHLEDRESPMGDDRPAGHHAYLSGRWSGRLKVSFRTVTPLLLPDASRATTDPEYRHKTYPIRRGPDGGPYLPPTSVKGMLRAAYEAVTNSRLGVFEEHNRRLGLRMEARDGLSLVPAAITLQGDRLQVRLMPGDSTIGDDGRPEEALMYAAWLPRYRKCWPDTKIGKGPRQVWTDKGEGDPGVSTCYPDGELPQHGDRVWVRLEKEQHRSGRFSFLRVQEIEPARDGREPQKGWRRGVVCITGRNIMNKHDERVFLEGPHDPPAFSLSLDSAPAEQWAELIADYSGIHEKDLQDRARGGKAPGDYLGHEPGKTGWSRHIFDTDHTRLDSGRTILCYARVSRAGASFLIHRFYPVMISRDLFESSPRGLLDGSLSPAESVDKLSPAERVFGWVLPDGAKARQNGPTAWKGLLRVGQVRCTAGESAIESFDDPAGGAPPGVPLAILGQPKPQQSRFYAARDKNGNPMPDGSRKKEGYVPGQALRGRKVYPHHRHLSDWADYWSNPTQDRTGVGKKREGKTYHQEYRRPDVTNQRGEDVTRDDQNRSILEWVRPDVQFSFDIHVTNLSPAELGALLWLLTLEEDMFLRLGGGKPLGFGSVHLALEGADLRDGDAWRAYYRYLLPPGDDEANEQSRRITGAEDPAAGECIRAFQQALIEAYPAPSFAAVSFVKAFEASCRGFADGLPLHYPRVDPAPNPEGKNFLWFTENDSRFGLQLALAGLHLDDRGLPLRPKGD